MEGVLFEDVAFGEDVVLLKDLFSVVGLDAFQSLVVFPLLFFAESADLLAQLEGLRVQTLSMGHLSYHYRLPLPTRFYLQLHHSALTVFFLGLSELLACLAVFDLHLLVLYPTVVTRF